MFPSVQQNLNVSNTHVAHFRLSHNQKLRMITIIINIMCQEPDSIPTQTALFYTFVYKCYLTSHVLRHTLVLNNCVSRCQLSAPGQSSLVR